MPKEGDVTLGMRDLITLKCCVSFRILDALNLVGNAQVYKMGQSDGELDLILNRINCLIKFHPQNHV